MCYIFKVSRKSTSGMANRHEGRRNDNIFNPPCIAQLRDVFECLAQINFWQVESSIAKTNRLQLGALDIR